MEALFLPYKLKGHDIRNRVVMPPMVCFGYADETGSVTHRNVQHYQERSDNGAGIIVTEATAVMKNGRAALSQLGIWSDEHIPGLTKISSLVKANGSVSLIQLHHAGLAAPEQVTAKPLGPSADEKKPGSKALSITEIEEIRDAFIHGAIRAQKAGFHGVELHGAHGYLLNQFANSFQNKREDEYGKDFNGRMKLVTEIYQGIRLVCGDTFILGCRMGANTPFLEDGIQVARYLENLGMDYLSISHGGMLINLPRPPKDFEYNWIVFCGITIKKEVKAPVMVVNEIRTAGRASWLIENEHADFVLIGRPQLADPQWVKHVREKQAVNACLNCKPKCRWYEGSDLCPAKKKLLQLNG